MGSTASKRNAIEQRLALQYADQESILAAVAAKNKQQRKLLLKQVRRRQVAERYNSADLFYPEASPTRSVRTPTAQVIDPMLSNTGCCNRPPSSTHHRLPPAHAYKIRGSSCLPPYLAEEQPPGQHLQPPANSNRYYYFQNQAQQQQVPTLASPRQSSAHIDMSSLVPSYCQRGLAFTEDERQRYDLLGVLPAAHQDQELQIKAVLNFIDQHCSDELSKYIYLRHLKDYNERLFYAAIGKHVQKLMPIVYTPTVGLGCQKFSHIFMRPRGLYVRINDLGRVASLLANWPERDVRAIVVTDGERILGLGDLGANGMGISIGKLSLYTALAGIPPRNVLPVCIDVGTNNQSNLDDPFYIGLRHKRIGGSQYQQLVDEFMKAVVDRWGRSCLIQFEDFANWSAFNLLQRYRDHYCTFNDDIQGTAAVCLSGLISAAKLTGQRLSDCTFLFYGAGEANIGTANLLLMALRDEGVATEAEAKRHIYLVDSKGLVVRSRTDLSEHKLHLANEGPELKDLEQIIDHVRPSAIIGACAQGGAFNESICSKMSQINKRPIIFALSNPTSKAECTAEQAYRWTKGTCVYASGSPFEPVVYEGKTYITGQGNNVYIFPGVGLAAIAAHVHSIPEETFLIAAKALSDLVTSEDNAVGLIYPKLDRAVEVTLRLAARVSEYFYAERLATYLPEPENKVDFFKSIQYNPHYPKHIQPEEHEALTQLSLDRQTKKAVSSSGS